MSTEEPIHTVTIQGVELLLDGDALMLVIPCRSAYAARVLAEDLAERHEAGQEIVLTLVKAGNGRLTRPAEPRR